MFGIGMSEMLIILAVALLVFGPNKLPEVAKSIARGLKELRRAGDDLRASVSFDIDDDRPRPRAPSRPPPPAVGAPADEPAHIPGSELAGGASLPTEPVAPLTSGGAPEEPWPKPAEGTLAQGALTDELPDGSAPASSTDASKVS